MGAIGRALGGLTAFCLSLVASNVAAADVNAVWRPQRVTFSYLGLTSRYACGEYEDRLRQILIALGAHEKLRIDRQECSTTTGMHLQITFMSPIEATPDNVRELTTFDSHEQLVARLQGTELPAGEDLARFSAEWQEVSLSRDRRIGLRAGDCELLEQVRRQLLPRLATRPIQKRLVCAENTLSRPPPLNVSALIASSRQTR